MPVFSIFGYFYLILMLVGQKERVTVAENYKYFSVLKLSGGC
jgi:hypothetical protein